MKIGAIGQVYSDSYSIQKVAGITPVEKTQQRDGRENPEVQQSLPSQTQQTGRKELQDIKVRDVYEQFPESFDHIGREKDLGKLDVEKAVSDMRKDKMLEQYQFFVEAGQNDDILFGSEDGIVIRKS